MLLGGWNFEDGTCVQFQRAPTLGGECYEQELIRVTIGPYRPFQWAPTLGGECYRDTVYLFVYDHKLGFQWAPTLGGECYWVPMQTHRKGVKARQFQWAPTLGGECYRLSDLG